MGGATRLDSLERIPLLLIWAGGAAIWFHETARLRLCGNCKPHRLRLAVAQTTAVWPIASAAAIESDSGLVLHNPAAIDQKMRSLLSTCVPCGNVTALSSDSGQAAAMAAMPHGLFRTNSGNLLPARAYDGGADFPLKAGLLSLRPAAARGRFGHNDKMPESNRSFSRKPLARCGEAG